MTDLNWDAIGAVGEIVGALAVVLSLAYLAVSIRQNTRQLSEQNLSNRMGALTSVGNSFSAFRTRVTSDSELSSLWTRGSQDLGKLSPEERARFDLLCVDLFWAWGMPWLYVQQGVLDANLWEFTKANLPLYAGPGVREWWSTSPHRAEYPTEFAEIVDVLLEEAPSRELPPSE